MSHAARPNPPRLALAPLALAPLALAVTLLLLAPPHARAQAAPATVVTIDIPAQPLARALSELARQAGLQVLTAPELVAGKSAPAVQGRLAPRDALRQLLAGSGLEAVMRGDVLVLRATPAALPGAVVTEQDLQTIVVTGKAEAPPGDLLQAYAGGQMARGGNVGILGNLDYMETPFSTTNITAQALQDQQARTVGAVLNNDASFQRDFPGGGFADRYTVRGFGTSETLNGLGGLNSGVRSSAEFFERVEVLKGPSALLYNGSAIGGNLGLVTKHAGEAPLTQFTASYASSSQLGIHADIGRRFGTQKEWGVRVNTLYRDGDINIDNTSDRLSGASVAVDYRGERLRASIDGLVDRFHTQSSRSQIYWDRTEGPLPRPPGSHSNSQQPWEFSAGAGNVVIGRVEYDPIDTVTLFAAIGRSKTEFWQQRGIPFNFQEDGSFEDDLGRYDEPTRATSGEAGVRWKFATGAVGHKLTLAYASTSKRAYASSSLSTYAFASNLYDPVVVAPPPTFSFGPMLPTTSSKTDSVVLTDVISLFENRLQVIAGVRHQRLRPMSYDADPNSPNAGAVSTQFDMSALSPAFGVVWRPQRWLSVYGNLIQALELGPQAPNDAQYVNRNELFPPTKTKQQEIGIKVDKDGLGATLALFRIAQPNARDVALGDGQFRFTVDGLQVNRGVELSVFGEPVRGWRLVGSATYLDPRYAKTQDGAQDGQRVPGYARWTANLGSEYDVALVPGLTLTGRIGHKMEQAFTLYGEPLRIVPAWTRYDLGARYAFRVDGREIALRASIENVADKNYWESSTNGLLLGAPRTVLLSATIDF